MTKYNEIKILDSAGVNVGNVNASGEISISLENLAAALSSNSGTQLNTTPFSSDGNEGIQLQNESGTAYGVKHIENKPRVSTMPYLYDIAEGNVPDHSGLFKVGYNPEVTTTEETIWSAGGVYEFPEAEQQMEVVSTDNTQDIGTVIKGDATGNTVVSDPDPIDPLTQLSDDDVDFTAATAVEVGDCVIFSPHDQSAYPAWGYVTAVAQHTLTFADGLSDGSSTASRPYAVIDLSASTGAQVVGFFYLDEDYIQYGEIVVLNGTTPVATVNTDLYRINSFAVIAAGSNCKPIGDLSITNLAGTIEYSHITAEYTISRQLVFTVPAGVTGYVSGGTISASTPNDTKVQTERVIVRTNENPDFQFRTGCLFYPIAEIVVCNETIPITFELPLKINEKTDFIVSGQGFTGFDGPINAVFRGWLE